MQDESCTYSTPASWFQFHFFLPSVIRLKVFKARSGSRTILHKRYWSMQIVKALHSVLYNPRSGKHKRVDRCDFVFAWFWRNKHERICLYLLWFLIIIITQPFYRKVHKVQWKQFLLREDERYRPNTHLMSIFIKEIVYVCSINIIAVFIYLYSLYMIVVARTEQTHSL